MKIKLLTAIVFVAGVQSILGCIKVEDSEKPNKSVQVTEKDSEISYEIQALEMPQKYLVRFKNLSSFSRVLRSPSQANEKALPLEGLEDVVDRPGWIQYRVLDQGRESVVNVEIPQDVVIEGEVKLNPADLEKAAPGEPFDWKWNVSGRLYFVAQSRLITEGRRVWIQAPILQSEGARILTWPEGVRAEFPNKGRSGGRLILSAHQLVGSLRIEMRGEAGSHGEEFNFTKKVKDLRNLGSDGGNTGQLWVDIEKMDFGQVHYELFPGEAGLGNDIMASKKNPDGTRSTWVDKPSMGDGQPGIRETPCRIRESACESF